MKGLSVSSLKSHPAVSADRSYFRSLDRYGSGVGVFCGFWLGCAANVRADNTISREKQKT
jgi:hypothetical protein